MLQTAPLAECACVSTFDNDIHHICLDCIHLLLDCSVMQQAWLPLLPPSVAELHRCQSLLLPQQSSLPASLNSSNGLSAYTPLWLD